MRISKPSPAMAVASVALFVSLGGTSVAAVSFARNAGAVDGKSAVGAGASANKAAGKLIATARSGAAKGQLPGSFVAGVGHVKAFGKAVKVVDEATAPPVFLGGTKSLGALTLSCGDSALQQPGVESPAVSLTFVASASQGVNFSRTTYTGTVRDPRTVNVVDYAAPGSTSTVAIPRSGPFDVRINAGTQELRFDGVSRDDAPGTPDAQCLVYGTITRVG